MTNEELRDAIQERFAVQLAECEQARTRRLRAWQAGDQDEYDRWYRAWSDAYDELGRAVGRLMLGEPING